MICIFFKLYPFIISIIFTTSLNKHVSAFYTEGIAGGYLADQEMFQYQVAIIGRTNFTDMYDVICNGGIIGENFVLSAAQCFAQTPDKLYDLSFSIVAGTNNLRSGQGIIVSIDLIYLALYDRTVSLNDIAVLKLAASLRFTQWPYLKKLNLPVYEEKVNQDLTMVAGFGYSWIVTKIHDIGGYEERIGGGGDYLLKFGIVSVLNDSVCRNNYPQINLEKQFCGALIPDIPGQRWGICWGDSGTPLVTKNKIVGIASRSPANCNDTLLGTVYTRISSFLTFIEVIMEGLSIGSAYVHRNPSHMLKRASS